MRSRHSRHSLASLLVIGLAAAALATSGLVELHDHILHPTFLAGDQAIQNWVHSFTSPSLTILMRLVSAIGSPFTIAPAVAIAATTLWLRKYHDDAILVAAAAFGAAALDELMKLHFKRTRPDVPWAFIHEHSFSFPSGHSVLAFVMYGVIVYKTQDKLRSPALKAALMIAAFLMVCAIGISRVYLGVHYPSDVAGGYFVGAIWLAAIIGSDLWIGRQNT